MNRASFPMKISLRFSFTEQVFSFTYFQIMDMVAELGGIGGIISSTIAGFAVYMILLFILDLVQLIVRKYKADKYQFTVNYYKGNLKRYRSVINHLLDPKNQNQNKKVNVLQELQAFMKEGGSQDSKNQKTKEKEQKEN